LWKSTIIYQIKTEISPMCEPALLPYNEIISATISVVGMAEHAIETSD
jgi:hypothetical protein